MKILFVSSEVAPFIKTGGLADVAGSLPKALKVSGQNIRVILPLYSDIPLAFREKMQYLGFVMIDIAWRHQYCGLYRTELDGVTYYFIDNEYYFKRNGLYGHYDDAERFAFFSKAVLEVLPLAKFYPNVLHCNDWHTALVPVFLNTFFRGNKNYTKMKTVFTIHNIQYQGKFDNCVLGDILGLDKENAKIVEYDGCVNFMKGAIEASDRVTTVSKTYAQEIFLPYYAYGLDNILHQRGYKVSGIVNGIDTDVYNPLTDKALFSNFDGMNIAKKVKNKKGLCELFSLPFNKDVPLISMVTRLTSHKGLDLVATVIEELLSFNIQMVVLGKGDWAYEELFKNIQKKYPNKFKAAITFSNDLASKFYAGSDMFLMPSQSEPCGLSQLISLRYGTIPIVRETGGLKDTVVPFNEETKEGNGFTFLTYDAYDMLDAIKRALVLYGKKEEWKVLVNNAMQGDYSWNKAALEYLALYKGI